jgi:glycosyltransferase involved in cell wall biosynthesis
MLSVIIPTFNSEREMQVLLPVLVPAAVDGLVREVIAADGGSTDATGLICEDAGVELVEGGLDVAAQAARGDMLLILPPSLRLRRGWDEVLRVHLEGKGGAALVAEGPPTFLERFGGVKLAGVLIAAAALHRTGATNLADLRRHVGRAKHLS